MQLVFDTFKILHSQRFVLKTSYLNFSMYKECLQSHCPQRFSLCIDDSIGLCFLQEFTRLPPTAQGQWEEAYDKRKELFMKILI